MLSTMLALKHWLIAVSAMHCLWWGCVWVHAAPAWVSATAAGPLCKLQAQLRRPRLMQAPRAAQEVRPGACISLGELLRRRRPL